MRQVVIFLQSHCRGWLTRKKLREERDKGAREEAACKIQVIPCVYLDIEYVMGVVQNKVDIYKRFLNIHLMFLQVFFHSQIEAKKAQQEFQRMRKAAVAIQKYYRAMCLGRKVRAEYLHMRAAAVTLQVR